MDYTKIQRKLDQNSRSHRLAAIMFTDIVGYTAVMGEDEDKAFNLLQKNRELQRPIIEKYGGTWLKEIGDAVLVSFTTDSNAVYCAKEIQEACKQEPDLQLRIGIHEGEVVFEKDDVYGDGVNIASRLQSIAPAEGIYISETVNRNIENKKGLVTYFIKEDILKNVKRPVKIYQVDTGNGMVMPNVRYDKKRSTYLNSFNWLAIIVIGSMSAGLLIGMVLTRNYTFESQSYRSDHLSINLTEGSEIPDASDHMITISPEGSMIVYAGLNNNGHILFRRSLNSTKIEPLHDTKGAENPFFSADGKWIGYYSNNALYKVPVIGGKSTLLCSTAKILGGVWLPNDSIVFGAYGRGIKIISANGGQPRNLTQIDFDNGEWSHTYPSWIPNTNSILYTRQSVASNISINLINTESGEDKVVVKNATKPLYLKSGYLIYEINNELYGGRFNLESSKIEGPSLILINKVELANPGLNLFYDLSNNGTFIYQKTQSLYSKKGKLVTIDMKGNETVLREEIEHYYGPKFSPDGENIAFWMKIDEKSQIWIYNLAKEQLAMFTSEGDNFWPIWSPTGNNLAFPSIRTGSFNVSAYWKSIVNSEPAIKLIESKVAIQPKAWTSDEQYLLFHFIDDNMDSNIHLLDMKTGITQPFLNEDHDEGKPDFSPDNKWVVYESNESGTFEIYAINFPQRSIRKQVSASGGNEPLWSKSGDIIFYRKDKDFYKVKVGSLKNELSLGKPEKLFSGNYMFIPSWGRSYDLSPDGTHFVTIKEVGNTGSNYIGVITNFEELVRAKFGFEN